ncbi:glycosyltransferase [Aeromicrobium endophyticum]|uniref:Glycosyltransferase n=1 Tax=Aeromicrobium endophyticum TaxID=2292704 RepID=A0A371PBS6_9ACTN|nr:glycosyltransferase [Aeromicrobium endophyticum]REK73008.1 glycosyltransferase [Aeromicrobium endophyticum]
MGLGAGRVSQAVATHSHSHRRIGFTMPSPHRIRVLPELRAVQVAQDQAFVPAETWYFGTNYDLNGTTIPDSFIRVSRAQAVWRTLRTPASVLEVPEPLWIRFLPTNLMILAAWRLSGWMRLTNRRARTYAIENNDLVSVVFGASHPVAPVRWMISLLMGLCVRVFYERVVFGTPGAAEVYRKLPFFTGVESSVVLGLPAAARAGSSVSEVRPLSAAFVGHLDARKGIEHLIEAWSLVEQAEPEATLVIAGAGPLEHKVAAWSSDAGTTSRTFVGQVPYGDVPELLSAVSVVVVPSQRSGRWREQIGLPIEEGLALGRTVVTTSETGLAPWLAEHGHHVVDARSGPPELAAAIISALRAPLDPSGVIASLPKEHARVAADRWLHEG